MSEEKNLYRIDAEIYRQLRNGCLQYWENKLKIANILHSGGNKPLVNSSSPGKYSDSTAQKALNLIRPEKFCEVIESIINKICSDYDDAADSKKLLHLSDFILLNVTTFNRYNSYRGFIRRGYNIVIGRDLFYFIRRKFFYELYEYIKIHRGFD